MAEVNQTNNILLNSLNIESYSNIENPNNEKTSNNYMVNIKVEFKSNKNAQKLKKIYWIWGQEKRFRYYLDVLLNQLLGMGIQEYRINNVNNNMLLLGILWREIMSNNNFNYSQSDYYFSVLNNIIEKNKELLVTLASSNNNFTNSTNARNLNNAKNSNNLYLFLNQLLEIIKNSFDKNVQTTNNMKLEIIDLKNKINGFILDKINDKNSNNEESIIIKKILLDIVYNLELLVYFLQNPLKNSDYFLAFILNAYKGRLISPFGYRKVIIDELDYFSKIENLMNKIKEITERNNSRNNYNLGDINKRFRNTNAGNIVKRKSKLINNGNESTYYNNFYEQLFNLTNLITSLKVINKNYLKKKQINSNNYLESTITLNKSKIEELKNEIKEKLRILLKNQNQKNLSKIENYINGINNSLELNNFLQYIKNNDSSSKLRIKLLINTINSIKNN